MRRHFVVKPYGSLSLLYSLTCYCEEFFKFLARLSCSCSCDISTHRDRLNNFYCNYMSYRRSYFQLTVCFPVHNYISWEFKPFTISFNTTHTTSIYNDGLANSQFGHITGYTCHLFGVFRKI